MYAAAWFILFLLISQFLQPSQIGIVDFLFYNPDVSDGMILCNGWAQAIGGIVQGLFSVGSSALGASSSSKASKAAGGSKTLNRLASIREQERLDLAKDQYELFRPLLSDFGGFFKTNSVDDLLSGRVFDNARAANAISNLNRSFDNVLTSQERSLARRGISNSAGAQVLRNDINQSRARGIGDAIEGIKQQGIDNRLRFLGFGQNAGSNVLSAAGSVANNLQNQSLQLAAQANQHSANATQSFNNAGASLADLIRLIPNGSARTQISGDSGIGASIAASNQG